MLRLRCDMANLAREERSAHIGAMQQGASTIATTDAVKESAMYKKAAGDGGDLHELSDLWAMGLMN